MAEAKPTPVIRVAEHLRAAFAPREASRIVFRPPATPMRCVPFTKHARHAGVGFGGPPTSGPMHHGGYGAGMPPPPPPHHQPPHHHAHPGDKQPPPPPPPPPMPASQQQQQGGAIKPPQAPPGPAGGAPAKNGAAHQLTPPRALQASAQPFMPASVSRAPDAGRPAPLSAVDPAMHESETESPTVVSRTTPLGVSYYAPQAFTLLRSAGSALPIPAPVLKLVKAMLPTISAGWLPPARTAEQLGMRSQASSPAAGSSDADDVRGGLFAGKSTVRRPERQLHHKVMSVLSRVTPQKYDELKAELLALPIRQADDEQLTAVVDVFFNKAVQEEKFSSLYADLVYSVFQEANDEVAAVNGTPTTPSTPAALNTLAYAEKTSALAKKLRFTLLTRCQTEFEKPYRLMPAETTGPDGKPVSAEELADRKWHLKKRLCGNIRFVGELYRCGIVTPRVITHILQRLLDQAAQSMHGEAPESVDDLLEVFVTLLTTVGTRYEEKCPEDTRRFIAVARSESQAKGTSPRIRFLLMNLVDLAERGWGDAPVSSPATGGPKPGSSFGASRAGSSSTPATPLAPGKRGDMAAALFVAGGGGSAKSKASPPGSGGNSAAKPQQAATTGTRSSMPSRANTGSQSFSNLQSSESLNGATNSGNGSAAQSPTRTKKAAKATPAAAAATTTTAAPAAVTTPTPLTPGTVTAAGSRPKATPAAGAAPAGGKHGDDSAAQGLPSSESTLAACAAPAQAAGLDAAARARVADARARASKLFAADPEAESLFEQLGSLGRDPASPTTPSRDCESRRAVLLKNYVRDVLATRRVAARRAALPSVLQLVAECPVVDVKFGNGAKHEVSLAAPWFSAAALEAIVAQTIHAAIGEGIFEDCPTFFDSVLELEDAASAEMKPLLAATAAGANGKWRVLPPGAVVRAAAAAIAAAAAEEAIEESEHFAALGRAAKARPANSAAAAAVRALVAAGEGGKGTSKGPGANVALSAEAREALAAACC